MKIYPIHTYLLAASCAMLTAGCSSDEELVEITAGSEAYIRIAAGTAGQSARAVSDEPQVDGQCNADRLTVYEYRGSHIGRNVSVSDMKFNRKSDVTVEHFSDPPYSTTDERNPYYQSDKWARKSVDVLELDGVRTTGFAFPTLAYTNAESDLFSVSPAVGDGYQALKLSLTGDITPEVYFGRVEAKPADKDDEFNTDDYKTTGIVHRYEALGARTLENVPLQGTLYRIVSQINIRITNVNTALVDRMTMELSNLPTEIGLYAQHRTAPGQTGTDHGFHYPIVASKESQHRNAVVTVSETSEFRKGVAELSTFLLPSELGRSLNVHIYFKDGTDKSYEVRPPKSHYIPAEMSEVYFSAEPLCVYNVTDNLFFSYANVRVNINGDFENFFPERNDVNMDVEICPRYDREHEYGSEDIDYN